MVTMTKEQMNKEQKKINNFIASNKGDVSINALYDEIVIVDPYKISRSIKVSEVNGIDLYFDETYITGSVRDEKALNLIWYHSVSQVILTINEDNDLGVIIKVYSKNL